MPARFVHAFSLAFALGFAAACGGSAPEPAPTPTSTPEATPQTMQQAAEQMAKGMEQFAKGLAGQPGPGQTATAVDFEQLVALLPEVEGWERGEPKGEQQAMAGIAVTNAKADYTKGESEITIEITDSSFNQLILAPLSMYLAAGFSERSTEGFRRGTTISGHPGFESWLNDSRRGEVTAVVANRFIVQATGRNVANTDAVKAFVQAVDLSKLAGLK